MSELAIVGVIIVLLLFLGWQRYIINEQRRLVEIWRDAAFRGEKNFKELVIEHQKEREQMRAEMLAAYDQIVTRLKTKLAALDTK